MKIADSSEVSGSCGVAEVDSRASGLVSLESFLLVAGDHIKLNSWVLRSGDLNSCSSLESSFRGIDKVRRVGFLVRFLNRYFHLVTVINKTS